MGIFGKLFKKYIFSDDLPFEARVLNMVCSFGLLAVLAATIGRLIEHSAFITMTAMYAMCVSIIILLYVSNRFSLHKQGAWVTLFVICDIFFPLIFITNGGIDSGMTAYFAMCVVIIFLLSSGRACFVLVVTNIFLAISCYIVNHMFPRLIIPLDEFQRYVDSILSFVITGLFIGFVTKTLSQMYHAEKEKANVASRAKGDFLARMSHEMRTPMNAIIGMTSIAQSSSDPERKDYCLNKINEASTHLLGVINDILDMSKIEANKLELSSVSFDFEKTLQKVANVINFRVDEKKQVFSIHIDENMPRTLTGDDQRLAQVITNLLSNAVKFTPEGGAIRLDARLLEEKNGECVIQVEISDTGIGISEEQQGKLFTSFEQADNTTSRKFGGTGLGLAISKRIVEMMGGRVWIESELGRGSTFTFTAVMGYRKKEERGSPLSSRVNWSNVRVLVVDDDKEVLEYFDEIMRRFGVNCSVAGGGEEALAMLRDHGPYDIYFIDWKMPDIDGIELSGKIKERGGVKCVVVMISAVEWSVIADEARNAGVDKFLPKPLFPSAIADCINECFGAEKALSVSDNARTAECFDGYSLLLVEDVEINREIVLSLFESTMLNIECAENGKEAVRMYSESPGKYDLILMDLQMPEMDGYEATRRIRALQIPGAAEIPIVAMTANVFKEDIEKCLESGMNDHLGKPIDFDDAMNKLRKYLPMKRESAAVV
jgi:signal transduction histidine kinase/DNA-binding response OmpR family regulator